MDEGGADDYIEQAGSYGVWSIRLRLLHHVPAVSVLVCGHTCPINVCSQYTHWNPLAVKTALNFHQGLAAGVPFQNLPELDTQAVDSILSQIMPEGRGCVNTTHLKICFKCRDTHPNTHRNYNAIKGLIKENKNNGTNKIHTYKLHFSCFIGVGDPDKWLSGGLKCVVLECLWYTERCRWRVSTPT